MSVLRFEASTDNSSPTGLSECDGWWGRSNSPGTRATCGQLWAQRALDGAVEDVRQAEIGVNLVAQHPDLPQAYPKRVHIHLLCDLVFQPRLQIHTGSYGSLCPQTKALHMQAVQGVLHGQCTLQPESTSLLALHSSVTHPQGGAQDSQVTDYFEEMKLTDNGRSVVVAEGAWGGTCLPS